MKDEPLNTFQQNARHVGKCAKLAADLASALQERDRMREALEQISTGILTVGEIMNVTDHALKGE